MSCNNICTSKDIVDARFDIAAVVAGSTVRFDDNRVGNMVHTSGAWGHRALNSMKGGILETAVHEVFEAHPDMVIVHGHTENPNARGIDHIVFDRATGTLVLAESKNWGRGDGSRATVHPSQTPTLQRSATELLSKVDLTNLTPGMQRAVRAAALNGNVARVLFTGPNCDAAPQPGVQTVSFKTLVGGGSRAA